MVVPAGVAVGAGVADPPGVPDGSVVADGVGDSDAGGVVSEDGASIEGSVEPGGVAGEPSDPDPGAQAATTRTRAASQASGLAEGKRRCGWSRRITAGTSVRVPMCADRRPAP